MVHLYGLIDVLAIVAVCLGAAYAIYRWSR